MKCHYEVLGVDLDCTSDDLKKAYRKLALEWHPDKNLSRLEEAKENFLLIQQAYEILSDPQERAWYDRHREDILRGGAEEAYKDDCLDVYQYFNSSCFKGYNDDEKGFYTVYRQVFEKITAEDKPFMDDDEDMEIPQFGYSHSSYDEVVHNFYAYWQSYCTAKTFSWLDKFDLSEVRKSGAGRQVIRAMEKENKKLRDAHKKLRNEEVRELVAFVRKRDKRVQAQKKIMEEKKAEKSKKAEEKRRQQIQERNKALENYEETAWSSMAQFENHFNEIESALDEKFGEKADETGENDEYDDLGDLYCVACEKDFRSEKAFKNHENSKKHKDNVALLKTLMEEEEAKFAVPETKEGGNESEGPDEDVHENEKVVEVSNHSAEMDHVESEPEESVTSEALLDELIKSSTKSKKKKKKNKAAAVGSKLNGEIDKVVEVQVEMENINIVEETPSPSTEQNDVGLKPVNKSMPTKKKGKKDKSNAAKKEDTNATQENEDSGEKPTTICGTCSNDFPSRNKLFEHLKQTGHAMFKNEKSASGGSGKKKGKKKL